MIGWPLLAVAVAAGVILAAIRWPKLGERQKALAERVLVWVCFTVLLSLIPLLLDYGSAFKAAHGIAPRWTITIERGELCLITTAMSGVAIGELFAARKANRFWTVTLGFLCLACALGSIGIYDLLHSDPDKASAPMLVVISGWVYLLGVAASTGSIAITEPQE
jgi:hypothetical protein